MASLFVIQGADQGKRFEFKTSPVPLGRDNSNAIRLHDTEVSRRHAEIRLEDELYRIVDLGSANGTFVNGHLVDQAPLHTGDRLQLGQTVMLYNEGALGAKRDLTARVDLLSKSSPEDRSAILRSIPSDEGSRVLQQPDGAAGWLRDRLTNLSVMYRATQAVSHILDIDSLLPQVLELVFESIGADRGAILLKEGGDDLVPKAVRWRLPEDSDERMTISRTIIDYVLEQGQGVITTDAPGDKRFSPAESIVDYRIREAICVPVQGRHTTLGVLYADIQSDGGLALAASGKGGRRGKFSQDQLTLMVAIGHQAGLAIENTTFYNDKIQAERLAAVGQTIATLSHHIKNILQGIRGGSYLIDLGLNEKDEAIVRRGWTIVEKNQTKIYNLVMDMLSFSKDREPALEAADLNETVADVIELMQSRADELGVRLEWTPCASIPKILIDPDGVHRAVLNIVTNAIDASEGASDACVVVSTEWTADAPTARIRVKDNGPGIDEADVPGIFQIFCSTKGSRGTGLGLPVSQKIIREHGGSISVTSQMGQGATFLIDLPATRRSDQKESDELMDLDEPMDSDD
ncbi:MAG: ATP-binding protein [Paludisphaera borealis]|uniref:ATP-binding protein n=1 Tax=Paludisphaera borealis TaxID=1387353 RepID=UPI00284B5B5C|nr:ATP-binding protein [Paludisphaera borealis]MDR3621306.1 ATP-binding protein [Paludisphaera borealis]